MAFELDTAGSAGKIARLVTGCCRLGVARAQPVQQKLARALGELPLRTKGTSRRPRRPPVVVGVGIGRDGGRIAAA